MDWKDIGVALSLMLIFEGVLPFLVPNRVRVVAITVLQLNDQTLRLVGLFCMVMGLGLLYWVR
ncbi:MAG: DUF2065 domain-containing protein [Gammaproteobacteria bacterium]|nr:MAG: DUF2065 domain-containing protein [Gammaproteobacteria bacterium]